MNKKYQRKYQLLKKRVKDVIFENAALLDQVAEIQSSVAKASGEKRFLLQRLLAHEPDYVLPEGIVDKKAATTPVRKKSQTQDRMKYNKVSDQLHPVLSSSTPPPQKTTIPKPTTPSTPLEPYTKARIKIEQSLPTGPSPDTPPPLSVKTEPSSTSTAPVHTIPEEFDATGNSYAIDNLVIQSLGEIQPHRPTFHTDQMIYPIGFTTIRIYGSMANPAVKSVYTCRIAEVAGNPRFEMSSEADPEVMIVGPSPQFCLTTLLNYMQETHGLTGLPLEPDGNWFFGLAHPVVMSLIEGMPNFELCSKFKGFAKVDSEAAIQEKENDPGINYESLMQLIGQSGQGYQDGQVVKEEVIVEQF